ncbi:DUF3052 domain-containing protein [Echinicola sp. CAU 1574]|uniref:DUF3052 domain-containing protein n=1 Tax=Echinicola arenosa TaxID=2774144 RepID=A0ABR9AFX6_9BACT|nr:DUF3052 domain-containing protein [Echinicola arenosa]MBD8487540.1 DUF3052 domain-containing protein [Echinicola arenosa]
MTTAGYSQTPLIKKLGIKDGFNILLINSPENYFDLLETLPQDLIFSESDREDLDFIHFFTKSAAEYERKIESLRSLIKPNGMIWVSWPKKASKIPTDMTENIIRDYALKIGLVDVKVCAVDAIWSGLKLVIPIKIRPKK